MASLSKLNKTVYLLGKIIYKNSYYLFYNFKGQINSFLFFNFLMSIIIQYVLMYEYVVQ